VREIETEGAWEIDDIAARLAPAGV